MPSKFLIHKYFNGGAQLMHRLLLIKTLLTNEDCWPQIYISTSSAVMVKKATKEPPTAHSIDVPLSQSSPAY